ncbi:MAG: ATP-binding protein [Elusimicrobiota bacterium]|jgi:predicted AAA+ superfamily ATPase|nr:ATP-binding protein [Elusimicrobiota bacterium]
MYISRQIESSILQSLKNFPITAITGPRQCGKSTLIHHIVEQMPNSVYLDLEKPSDLQKLENAEWFLTSQKGKLICIDEIQRQPELFPLLRVLADEWKYTGCFLILGSASRQMLKQSSESLAGRIIYKRLTPFLIDEVKSQFTMEQYFSMGAFPPSLISADNQISYEWRENFISTFLQQDLLQWAGFSPVTMRRLWQMLAHMNGQTVNYSSFSVSLGISDSSVRNYIDLLASAYMVEIIAPYFSNIGKRLVKAPKVYIADSGLTACLLGLNSFEALSGHSSFGSIWEQIVLSNIRGWFPQAEIFHYRTAHGAEIDFIVKIDASIYAIECKASYSPIVSKGIYAAIDDVKPKHTFVVIPSKDSWTMKEGIDIVSLMDLKSRLVE